MSEVDENVNEVDLRILARVNARIQAAQEAERLRQLAGTLVIDEDQLGALQLMAIVNDMIDEKQVGNKHPKRLIDSSLVLLFHPKEGRTEGRRVDVPAGATVIKDTQRRIFVELNCQSLTMDRRASGVLVFKRSSFGAEPQRAVFHHQSGAQRAVDSVR